MPNDTLNLSPEIPQDKLNFLAAEYASLTKVALSPNSDNDGDFLTSENDNNLLTWLENTVQIEINAPIDLVWDLWSDLEQIPHWMKWIDSVKVLEDDPLLSRWRFDHGGVQFTWLSRIQKLVPYQMILWESVDGSPNRGAVRFYDRHSSTIVRFTVAYAVPGILANIMNYLLLERLVKSELENNLENFQDYVNSSIGESVINTQ